MRIVLSGFTIPVMKLPPLRLSPLVLASLATLLFLPHTASADEDGFQSLGPAPEGAENRLAGWNNPFDWGKAEVVGDEIHLTADKKFFLVTDAQYSDFVFEGEVLLPEGQANSGFMFRCHVEHNKVYGYQCEIDGSERRWSGGLYDEGRFGWLWPSKTGRTKMESALKHEKESQEYFQKPEIRDAFKRNDWNHVRITCKGNSIKLEINGVLITDYKDDTDAKGHLGIQHHGEKGQTYRFRNLRVKPL